MWLEEKRSGPGKDPRIAPQAPSKERGLFRVATAPLKRVEMPNRIFGVVVAVAEVEQALYSTRQDPAGSPALWVQQSGVSPRSGVAFEHALLLNLLWIMDRVDRLGVTTIEAAEPASRRVLKIERALKRNARNPDFTGLEAYMNKFLEAGGASPSPDFNKHFASIRKDEALIMKSLWVENEEQESESRKRANTNKKVNDCKTEE